jgi:ankyrin repeat protein
MRQTCNLAVLVAAIVGLNGVLRCAESPDNSVQYSRADSPAAATTQNADQNKKPAPPLVLAVVKRDYVLANSILRSGTDPDVRDADGNSALFYLVGKYGVYSAEFEMAKQLISRGAKVNGRCELGRTPLMNCCLTGNPTIAFFLQKSGADFTLTDTDGNTCLHLALQGEEEGRIEMVRFLLLQRDVAVNAKNHQGKTALDLARQPDPRSFLAPQKNEMAGLLLDNGGKPGTPSTRPDTRESQ